MRNASTRELYIVNSWIRIYILVNHSVLRDLVQRTHRAPWTASPDRSILSSESDDSSSDSDSDSSWKSFSPITSDDDDDDDDDDDFNGDSGDEESVPGSEEEDFSDPSTTHPEQTEPSAAQSAPIPLNSPGSFK